MSNHLLSAMEDEQPRVPSSNATYNINVPRGGRSSRDALVPIKDKPGVYTFKGCEITRAGAIIPPETSQEVWGELGEILMDMETSIAFALGDWLAFGDDREWGKAYQDMAERHGLRVETLWSYASVCRKTLIRNQGLSFAHHRKVMALTHPDTGEKLEGDDLAAWQEYWLAQAYEHGWTVVQLDEAINGKRPAPPDPKGDPVGFIHHSLNKLSRRLPRIKDLDSGQRMQIAQLLEDQARQYREG